MRVYHTYFNLAGGGSPVMEYEYVTSTAAAEARMWTNRGCVAGGAGNTRIDCNDTAVSFYAPLVLGWSKGCAGKLDEARLYYEEALLFLLIRLRNPRSRVIYVTSRPLPQSVIDYYLQFLAGIPISHAAARLTLLSAYDGSARPLTEKVLERPRLVEKIKSSITNLERAYLTVFRSTPLERRLALRLGIPLNAADPEMEDHLGKSGAKKTTGKKHPF